MAWFGDNLKSLTGNLSGQLSSVANTAATFATDVLAEGTEEVSDQTTELKLAQDKIKQLDTFVISQKAENERLQILNTELSEKAEASELQINTISQQYRTVLQEKQDEIKGLKQQQHAMQDLHQNMMSASTNPDVGLSSSTSTSSLSNSALTADDRDFVDVISSQHEINRLSNEVRRLTHESNHWREKAEAQPTQSPHFQVGGDYVDSADDPSQLKTRIKELERQLSREIDESQHQMSMIQNAHSQKTSNLIKKHKTEMEDYHNRIEDLEQAMSSGSTSPASTPTTTIMRVPSPDVAEVVGDSEVQQLHEALARTQQQIAHLESENQGLDLEVQTLRQSDRERGEDVGGLHQQIEDLEQERDTLLHDNDILIYVKKDLAAKLDIEQEESGKWKIEAEEVQKNMEKQKELMDKQREEEVDLLQQRIKEQEDEMSALREDNDKASTTTLKQEVKDARKKLTSQDMLRRTRLLQEKQDLVNRMIEVSDNKNSIATLQTAHADAWDQTASVVTDMGDAEQQELTAEFINCLESENKILRDKVIHLESVERTLNESCASLAEDKDQCEGLILTLNKRIQTLKAGGADPETCSERTLECTMDSETESTRKPKSPTRSLSPRRSLSPSGASMDSDVTASSAGVAHVRDGMSEGTTESDLPESRMSHLESSDNVSFDGEYDDSMMFGGLKERYPEAANALKEQIEQFELVRADWEMEKEALEEVVVRMRDQLKEKDRALESLTAEKGLIELENQQTEELNAAVKEMDQKIETLEAAKKSIEDDKEVVMKEKDSLEVKIHKLESTHQEQVAKLQTLTEHKDQLQVQLTEKGESISNLGHEVESYRSQLQEKEESINNLSMEVDSFRNQLQDKEASLLDVSEDKGRLEGELQELDNQHMEAINQVLSSKDSLAKMVDNLKEQLAEKESALNESQSMQENLEMELDQWKENSQHENQELSETQKSGQAPHEEVESLKSALRKLSEENIVLDNRKSELEIDVNDLSNKVTFLEKAASLEEELKMRNQKFEGVIDAEEKAQNDDVIAKLQQDVNEAVSAKDTAEKDYQELVEQKEKELQDVFLEKEGLNQTLSEKDDELQVFMHSLEQKTKELSDVQMDFEALSAEKEDLCSNLKHSQQALEDQKQQFDTSLHELSDSRDMDSSHIQDEYEKLILLKNEQDAEITQMKSKWESMEEDLNCSKEMLNTTLENHKQLAEMVKEKETDIKNLAEENSFFFKAVEEGKTKLKEQLQELRRLENIDRQLDGLKVEKACLAMRIKELEDAGDHWQDAESKTLGLITDMEVELGEFKKSLEERDEEVVKLNQVIEEQEASMSELQDQCSLQADELELSRSKFADSMGDFTSLNQSMGDKDNEISELSQELDNMRQLLADEQSSRLPDVDSSVVEKEAEISDLNMKVNKLSAELDNTNRSFVDKVTHKDEEIRNLQKHVNQLNLDLESHQQQANDLQDKLDTTVHEKDEIISDMKDTVNDLTMNRDKMDNHSMEKDIQTNRTVIESTVISRGVELTQSSPLHVGNPNMHPAMSDTEKQFEKMVQERDRDITMLKDEKQSILNLLEDKSQTALGNSSLVDLHKLQMQVRTYNSERNQMMAVLNEKTRECSNLKNEVHRLVKTVAAEKSALEKALADNRDIQQSMHEPRKDMQKEALTKLSRIIQDKDLELEALKLKNESLLQVLQQSAAPNDSTQISKVLQENEQFQKDNKVLKEERDQLVVSIHQKHHESLSYYEEVQRLAGVISVENQKHAELQEKYNNIYADLDDKEKGMGRLEVKLKEKHDLLSNLQDELDQRNESVSILESQIVNLNNSLEGLESRNEELAESHHKQNQEDDLHLKVMEDKDAEILELKQQLQSMTLMSLDHAADGGEEVVRVQMSPVQHASPPVSGQVVEEVVKVQNALLQHAPPPSAQVPRIDPTVPHIDPTVLEAKDQQIDTLKETIEHQNNVITEIETCIKQRNSELERTRIELASLRQEIDIQNQNLLGRDATLQLRGQEVKELSNRVRGQEVELQSLKHSNRTLTVQLEGYKQEIQTLKTDNQTLQHAVHNKDGENRSLQDMSNQLAVQVQEKEFEIGALKEKNATLTSLVQEKDIGSQGELTRMLRETEAMQRQAQRFQQERDQAFLALQRHQAEAQAKDEQLQGRQQKEQQLGRELDRLRNHLIEMEDSYTQEALQAEERETDLRTRLGRAEEMARSSSSGLQNASKEATAQIDSLLDQLNAASDTKDQALLQLAAVQEQAQQYATSLNNLQMVLEQFQQEKDLAVASEVEMYQIRAQEKDRVAGQLLKTNVELQEKLATKTEALEGASRLSEQLDKKEGLIEQLRKENELKAQEIEEYQNRFQRVSDVQESKVDKPLVKNLFLGYFHAPKSKRGDVVKIMSSLLNFTPDEIRQINTEGEQAQGWLGGLWGRRAAPTPPTSPRHNKSMSAFDTSFTESFVKFLQEESAAKPRMRLPVEEMSSTRKPAFNPFSAPIPQASPYIHTSPAAKGPGVPLPVQAAQAFTPLPISVRPATPVIEPGGSGPGRGSPAKSAAVLKDILQ